MCRVIFYSLVNWVFFTCWESFLWLTQAVCTLCCNLFNLSALSSRPAQLCCCSGSTLRLQRRISPGESERLKPPSGCLNTELSPFLPPGAGCAFSQSGCLWRRPRLDRCRRGWPAALPTCAAVTCPSWRWIRLWARSAPAGLHSLDALEGKSPHREVSVHLETSI